MERGGDDKEEVSPDGKNVTIVLKASTSRKGGF
jgi:hypothetical protein